MGQDREAILERLDMLDFVQDWLTGPLKGPDARGNYWTSCFLPGHNHSSNTPSLSIHAEKKTFYCHGDCGRVGSAFDMFMLMNNINPASKNAFPEVLEKMAAIVGYDMKPLDNDVRERMNKRARKEEVLTEVAMYMWDNCKRTPKAMEYITGTRAIPAELVDKFRLGYANAMGTLPRKFSVQDYLDVGLLRKYGDDRNARVYPFFRKCIVIPVFRYGRCVYMTARSIDPEARTSHLHLPLGDGDHIPAFWNEDAITTGNGVWILEAPIDAISTCSVGFDSIGILGVQHLQERSLKKFDPAKDYTLAFDNDPAGIKNTARAGTLLSDHCTKILTVVTFPAEYKDANKTLREIGAQGLLECIDTMQVFSSWLLRYSWQTDRPLLKNTNAIRTALNTVHNLEPIEVDLALRDMSDVLADLTHGKSISPELLRKQLAAQRMNGGTGG